jgi:hypothetical protein
MDFVEILSDAQLKIVEPLDVVVPGLIRVTV